MPHTRWFKQQIYILSILETVSLRCWQEWFLLRPLCLTCRWLSWLVDPCAFTCFFLCVCALISSSYRNTSHIGLWPTLLTFKDPIYKYSYILRYCGTSAYVFEGACFSLLYIIYLFVLLRKMIFLNSICFPQVLKSQYIA